MERQHKDILDITSKLLASLPKDYSKLTQKEIEDNEIKFGKLYGKGWKGNAVYLSGDDQPNDWKTSEIIKVTIHKPILHNSNQDQPCDKRLHPWLNFDNTKIASIYGPVVSHVNTQDHYGLMWQCEFITLIKYLPEIRKVLEDFNHGDQWRVWETEKIINGHLSVGLS